MEKTEPMTEKERFVTLAQTGRFTITELCSDFGISRKTGHKYLRRHEADGRAGLKDRSRRPKRSPTTTAEEVTEPRTRHKMGWAQRRPPLQNRGARGAAVRSGGSDLEPLIVETGCPLWR